MDAICRQAVNRGAILLWVPVLCGEAADPRGRQKGPGEKGSNPSTGEKEKPRVTVAQGFIHKCTEKDKVRSYPFYSISSDSIYFFIMSFHLLLLFNKI